MKGGDKIVTEEYHEENVSEKLIILTHEVEEIQETLVILKTSHRGGIMHLTFSNDGSLLLSIGMDKTFSM